MLNESCRRFREDFTPGRDPELMLHRRVCAACEAWAGAVEAGSRWAKTAAGSDRPLPAGLRSRLRSVPRQTTTCRETERLYAAARHQAAGRAPDPAAAEHLTACDRCRALYGALRSAFSEELPPPPRRLVTALKKIVRSPAHRLPDWIAEPRLATAACILMTVLLSSMATDAAALFRDARGTVTAKAAVWAEEGESRSRRMWQTAATASADSYESSREQLSGFAESCRTFLQQTIRIFGSLTEITDETPDGGSPDGNSKAESE